MSQQFVTLAELADQLGRDRREVERLVQRGRIPGHKIDGEWRFHPTEIRHWLEHQMSGLSEVELSSLERSQGETEARFDLPVSSLLKLELVAVPLEARTKRSVLETLVEVAGRTWQVWEPAVVLQAVIEREEVFSTALGNGVVIPHPRNPLPNSLGESLIAFGRTMAGIPFGAPNRQLSDIFFLILCRDSRTHLQVLARLGRLLQQPGFVDSLRELDTPAATYDAICEADRQISAA